MEANEHFFRREAARIIAALTRVFGLHNLALAEDVTQDVLCRALEVWRLRGVPERPGAWLMTAAKHRAIDALRRERTARTFAPELTRWLTTEWTLTPTMGELLADHVIQDDLLRMMFSCCNPRLPEEVQVALVLNLLCGFGTGEIAAAFLCSQAAIEKRITRGKKVLVRSGKLVEVSEERNVREQLPAIHRALYLLFNEGYHGTSSQATSADLCDEAMRLASLLLEHRLTGTHTTQALLALMCLHAGRLPSRVDGTGQLVALRDQDRRGWDQSLIARGLELLEQSACQPEVSEYQLEAAIAAMHARAPSVEETRWDVIVTLFDALFQIRPSPVVALNRAIAVGHASGPDQGLEALRSIENRERLNEYPFYFAALGEFELRAGRKAVAREQFQLALTKARSLQEKSFLQARVLECNRSSRDE